MNEITGKYSKEKMILGRDRLGRLVYPGDYRSEDWRGEPLWARIITPAICPSHIRTCGYDCPPNSITVDLSVSPKMSNYDRYFAEYGSVGEIIGLARQRLFEQSEQVFWRDFKESFGAGFSSWLQKEATI